MTAFITGSHGGMSVRVSFFLKCLSTCASLQPFSKGPKDCPGATLISSLIFTVTAWKCNLLSQNLFAKIHTCIFIFTHIVIGFVGKADVYTSLWYVHSGLIGSIAFLLFRTNLSVFLDVPWPDNIWLLGFKITNVFYSSYKTQPVYTPAFVSQQQKL